MTRGVREDSGSNSEAGEKWGEKPSSFFELLKQWGFDDEKASRFAGEKFRKVLYTAYRVIKGDSYISGHEWRGFLEEQFGRDMNPGEYIEKAKEMIKTRLRAGYPEKWFLEIVQTREDLLEELSYTRQAHGKISKGYAAIQEERNSLLEANQNIEISAQRGQEEMKEINKALCEVEELLGISLGRDAISKVDGMKGLVLQNEETKKRVIESVGNLRRLILDSAAKAGFTDINIRADKLGNALEDIYEAIWVLFGSSESLLKRVEEEELDGGKK